MNLAALWTILALALGAAPSAAGGPGVAPRDTAATTTVVMVRHAEKNTEWMGADQPLTAAGMLRARELAWVLGDVPIQAIFVTPWMRSRQTAEPLARKLGLTPLVVDPIDETVQRIRERRGQTVLAVGHSNTVPQILSALMGKAETDTTIQAGYDDLYVLTLANGSTPRLVRLHYGAPAGKAH